MTSQEAFPPSISTLFPENQWAQVRSLCEQLNPRQRLWLSGYLMALEGENTIPSTATKGSAEKTILVAYGTETGNSKQLAQKLAEQLTAARLNNTVVDLADYRLRQLTREHLLILVCSTHGDGDPPEPVREFYDAIMNEKAPRLEQLQFAVLAMGDSSYLPFCQTGKDFDERLEKLGAKRLQARQDCDVDYAEPARIWMQNLLENLKQNSELVNDNNHSLDARSVASGKSNASLNPTAIDSQYTKQNPYCATIVNNVRLSGNDKNSVIHHLELACDDAAFDITAGDAIGVYAQNNSELVSKIIACAKLDPAAQIVIEQHTMSLQEALSDKLDVVVPGKRFVEQWAQWSQSDALTAVVTADSAQQRQFLRTNQIIDLVSSYPAAPAAQDFVSCLRPLQPRLYDLANSVVNDAGEIHITVKEYAYDFNRRLEKGVASRYLTQLKSDEKVMIYPHKNLRFRLPQTPGVPLILIAHGTGVAPYRAFLQTLVEQNIQHPCWLIFHGSSRQEGFLYQADWIHARDKNLLLRSDCTFDTETPTGGLELSVSTHAERLSEWLALGAHVYFSGDKDPLKSCESLLENLCTDNLIGDSSLSNAELKLRKNGCSWKDLAKEGRIHRNTY